MPDGLWGEERRRASERGSGVKAGSSEDDPVKMDVLKGPRRARRPRRFENSSDAVIESKRTFYNAFPFYLITFCSTERRRRGKAGDCIIRSLERSDRPFYHLYVDF